MACIVCNSNEPNPFGNWCAVCFWKRVEDATNRMQDEIQQSIGKSPEVLMDDYVIDNTEEVTND